MKQLLMVILLLLARTTWCQYPLGDSGNVFTWTCNGELCIRCTDNGLCTQVPVSPLDIKPAPALTPGTIFAASSTLQPVMKRVYTCSPPFTMETWQVDPSSPVTYMWSSGQPLPIMSYQPVSGGQNVVLNVVSVIDPDPNDQHPPRCVVTAPPASPSVVPLTKAPLTKKDNDEQVPILNGRSDLLPDHYLGIISKSFSDKPDGSLYYKMPAEPSESLMDLATATTYLLNENSTLQREKATLLRAIKEKNNIIDSQAKKIVAYKQYCTIWDGGKK